MNYNHWELWKGRNHRFRLFSNHLQFQEFNVTILSIFPKNVMKSDSSWYIPIVTLKSMFQQSKLAHEIFNHIEDADLTTVHDHEITLNIGHYRMWSNDYYYHQCQCKQRWEPRPVWIKSQLLDIDWTNSHIHPVSMLSLFQCRWFHFWLRMMSIGFDQNK